jgi:hypothetical protein
VNDLLQRTLQALLELDRRIIGNPSADVEVVRSRSRRGLLLLAIAFVAGGLLLAPDALRSLAALGDPRAVGPVLSFGGAVLLAAVIHRDTT